MCPNDFYSTPEGIVYEPPGKKVLTDVETRLLIYQATRIKNKKIRYALIKLNGNSIGVEPLIKAA